VVKLIDAAQQSMNSLANGAPAVGTNLDITIAAARVSFVATLTFRECATPAIRREPMRDLNAGGVGCRTGSFLSAFFSAQVGQLRLAVAARLVGTDPNNPINPGVGPSVTKLVDAAQQSAQPLANVAAGLGTNLDMRC
jgi:hypothetical protein